MRFLFQVSFSERGEVLQVFELVFRRAVKPYLYSRDLNPRIIYVKCHSEGLIVSVLSI